MYILSISVGVYLLQTVCFTRNNSSLNPNKAGLFEGSFLRVGGQFNPPPSYFKKNLSDINITQYNFMQLLDSLFKAYWKRKNADIICYKLISLVSSNKEMSANPKTRWKSMKIANIDR